jgi:XapX domain-containing protein
MQEIKTILISFVVGIVTGGIFTFLKLPLPAATNWAGIIGIVGIFVGYLLVNLLRKLF